VPTDTANANVIVAIHPDPSRGDIDAMCHVEDVDTQEPDHAHRECREAVKCQIPPPDFLVEVLCFAERKTRIQDHAVNQRKFNRQCQFKAVLDHGRRRCQEQNHHARERAEPAALEERADGYDQNAHLQYQRDSQLNAVYPALGISLLSIVRHRNPLRASYGSGFFNVCPTVMFRF
jgi:hypothetical protein